MTERPRQPWGRTGLTPAVWAGFELLNQPPAGRLLSPEKGLESQLPGQPLLRLAAQQAPPLPFDLLPPTVLGSFLRPKPPPPLLTFQLLLQGRFALLPLLLLAAASSLGPEQSRVGR